MFLRRSFSIFTAVIAIIFALPVIPFHSQGQNQKYYPKGNPDKWNCSLTPFLLAPIIDGHVQSKNLSEDFGIGTADFLKTLHGTFMMAAEVSKGKFFAAPLYIYTYNEIEKTIWTTDNGFSSVSANPSMKKSIFELKSGMRLRLNENLIVDPYVGFRYTYYYIFGSVNGIKNYSEINEKEYFFDPIFGIQAHYYFNPRFPIEFRADCGGFGVGSKFTWSVNLNGGYTVSPTTDLLIGFAALENQYENETSSGNAYGMTSLIYGINFGARFYLPQRFKDPLIFKK